MRHSGICPGSYRSGWYALTSLLLGLLLTACGGDGGGSTASAPDTPKLSLSPQSIKTFAFSWTDVSSETEYRLLENPDGLSGYTRVATIPADASSHNLDVFLPARINASYILQACNSKGCTDSDEVFVSDAIAATGYLKASNADLGDGFGSSVALAADGNTLAVGAPLESSSATGIDGDETDNSAKLSGAVYVFTRNGTSWAQQAYLKASYHDAGLDFFGADTGDWFGRSIALAADGNTLAVGAFYEDSRATGIDGDETDNSTRNSGAVYVFTRSGTSWTQQAYVKASNTDGGPTDEGPIVPDGDLFGYSIALAADGNTLAVGAPGESSSATGIGGDETDNSATNSGAVYVFTRSGASWAQQAYVKASNTGRYDGFGSSVTLAADGNTLAVGATGENSSATGIDGDETDNSAIDSGAVYVFTRSGASWAQQAYVKASNTNENDGGGFGLSIALAADGNTLAVGAPYGDSGVVSVFTRSGASWAQEAYLKANTDGCDWFGRSIALAADGNTLAVGAFYESGLAVSVFTRSGASWTQQAYVNAPNGYQTIRRGNSVTLAADGNTLAVGAPEEGYSGVVYLF